MTASVPSPDDKKTASLEAYFEFEYQAERRHEYIGGKIVAMAYTSEEHGTLVHNLDVALGNCLREKDCKVYPGDRMLFVPACQEVFYPDLLVVCGQQEFHQAGPKMKATLNPLVVIEILSESTAFLDKTTKTRCYKQISSLRQIVFVSQKETHVRILEREGERWIDTEFYEKNDLLKIAGCAIPLMEVYRKVEFPENT